MMNFRSAGQDVLIRPIVKGIPITADFIHDKVACFSGDRVGRYCRGKRGVAARTAWGQRGSYTTLRGLSTWKFSLIASI